MRSRKVNTGGKIARPRAKFKPLLRKEKDKERGRERKRSRNSIVQSHYSLGLLLERVLRGAAFSRGIPKVPARRVFFCTLPRHRRRASLIVLLASSLQDRIPSNFFNRVYLLSLPLSPRIAYVESTV